MLAEAHIREGLQKQISDKEIELSNLKNQVANVNLFMFLRNKTKIQNLIQTSLKSYLILLDSG